METRLRRRKRIGSLPEGNRRGTSGADAGCFSMRTIGGEELNRRALVESNYATADDSSSQSSSSLFPSPTPSPLSLCPSSSSSNSPLTTESCSSPVDVAQEAAVNDPAPAAGKTRARRLWTVEMNKFIWRTYLIITSLETETRNYLTALHEQFTLKFPDMKATKQRIGDQRRAIVRNKLLSDDILDEIKKDIQNTNPQLTYATPAAPKSTRIKWNNDMNEAIIKAYYTITNIETNKTAYRHQLYIKFIEQFPYLSHLSEQRIADQRRVIVRNKLITEDKLQEIRNEIMQTINISDQTNITHITTTETTNIDRLEENTHTHERDSNTDCYNDINVVFEETYNKFKDSDPTQRPYIPKQKTSKTLASIVSHINTEILPKLTNVDQDYQTIQTIIYSAAYTAAFCNGSKIKDTIERTSTSKSKHPAWRRRLEKKVDILRQDIGRMTRYINNNRSSKLNRRIVDIRKRHAIHSRHEEHNTTDTQILDTLKQKLSVVANRLSRYINCSLRKQQNSQFLNSERQFYRRLGTNTENKKNTTSISPSIQDIHQYWSDIWSQPIRHNSSADWIQTDTDLNKNIPDMQFDHIPIDTFIEVIKKAHNWKTPGTDHIHNYWYKKFTTVHPMLYNHLNKFIESPDTLPTYISEGITYLIPKKADNETPSNYRPITCLQTIYKILTACISETIYKHVTTNNILAEEQKGCRKLSQGCKEQLIIDSVVMKQAKVLKRDISTMYIDYKKAFDSIPHSWLIHILHNYKIHSKIISFLEKTMQNWRTKLKITTGTDTLCTPTIHIRRGIFQGDALSPLWFCIALNPLSHMLNRSDDGVLISYNNSEQIKLTHLMYMDDIKLYSNETHTLHHLADITQKFSNDIHMEFGIDKCKTFTVKRGVILQNNYTLQSGKQIEPIETHCSYKYLGFEQSQQIHMRDTKIHIKNKFTNRLNLILKSKLNSRNLVKAINTFAVPTLTYSFGIINWTQTDLKTLQRTINIRMTNHRKHHPRSCVQRMTLPRDEGGRGIIDLVNLHNKQVTTLRHFFYRRAEHSTLHSTIVDADVQLTPLNLHDHTDQRNEKITEQIEKIGSWKQKSLHGRHRQDLSQSNVDKKASNAWLRHGELFPETEGFMIAIQDQVIETRNYLKFIVKKPNIIDTCRRCRNAPETIQHITGSCSAIAQTDYKHRHDQVANIIHQKLAHKHKLTAQPYQPYYKYKPEAFLENTTHKLYFDRAILTDKTIHYNRPDITLVDKTNKTTHIIDIAIPNTHNLQTTIGEKIRKYTDLKQEITRMWHMSQVTILPIVLSATGVIPTNLQPSLKTIELSPQTYITLQKATVLNTCRIVRKFLDHPSIIINS